MERAEARLLRTRLGVTTRLGRTTDWINAVGSTACPRGYFQGDHTPKARWTLAVLNTQGKPMMTPESKCRGSPWLQRRKAEQSTKSAGHGAKAGPPERIKIKQLPSGKAPQREQGPRPGG